MLGARAGIPARVMSVTYDRPVIIRLNDAKTRPIAAWLLAEAGQPWASWSRWSTSSYSTRSPLKNIRARGRIIFLFFPRAALACAEN